MSHKLLTITTSITICNLHTSTAYFSTYFPIFLKNDKRVHLINYYPKCKMKNIFWNSLCPQSATIIWMFHICWNPWRRRWIWCRTGNWSSFDNSKTRVDHDNCHKSDKQGWTHIWRKFVKFEYSGKFVKIEKEEDKDLAINAIDDKDDVKDEGSRINIFIFCTVYITFRRIHS